VFDAGLPGAAVLFDAALLSGGVEAAPGPMAVEYLRYKPGVSLTAAISTSVGMAMAYVVAEGATAKLEKLVHRAPPAAVLCHDPVRRWALLRPDADRDLPGIAHGAGPQPRTLSYKPQRRWVGRRQDRPDEVMRCYRRRDVEAISVRWPEATVAVEVSATAGSRLVLPEVLSLSRQRATLTTSRVQGTALHPDGSGRGELMMRVGRALAAWHRLPAPVHPCTPGISLATGDVLRGLLPTQHERVDELESRLRSLPPAPRQQAVWCHGDFSADQVLVDDHGEMALIDWDRSGAGPRSTDLAVADAAGMAPEAYESLLGGYTQLAPLPVDLPMARALACWSRAADPFRQADPEWAHRIEERLNHIEELLG
jgi:aminoglycoside phosphotransferase